MSLKDDKYNRSEKGRAAQARYNHSEKGRERQARYNHSDRGRANHIRNNMKERGDFGAWLQNFSVTRITEIRDDGT